MTKQINKIEDLHFYKKDNLTRQEIKNLKAAGKIVKKMPLSDCNLSKEGSAFDSALLAYDLNNYLSIESLNLLSNKWFDEIDYQMAQKYNSCNQEDLLIEIDLDNNKLKLFESLSEEAKDIIRIIQDCPEDMKEICLAGKLDKVSISKLISLIRRQWGQRIAVREIFREVFSYALKLKELNTAI